MKFAPPFSPKKISIPVKIVHRIQRRENWINSKKRERESIGAELVFNFFCRINAKIGEGRLGVGGESWKKKKARQTRLIKVESYCGLGRKYTGSNPSGLPRFHVAQNKDFELQPVHRGQLSVTRARVCICPAESWTRGRGKGGGNCLSIASKIDDIASRKIKPARVLRADKIIGNREGWDRWRYEGRKGEEEEPITRTASWNPMLDLLHCIRAVLRLVVYLYRDPTRRLFRVNDEYLYTRSSRVTCRHCVPALVRRIESRVNWKTFLE